MRRSCGESGQYQKWKWAIQEIKDDQREKRKDQMIKVNRRSALINTNRPFSSNCTLTKIYTLIDFASLFKIVVGPFISRLNSEDFWKFFLCLDIICLCFYIACFLKMLIFFEIIEIFMKILRFLTVFSGKRFCTVSYSHAIHIIRFSMKFQIELSMPGCSAV